MNTYDEELPGGFQDADFEMRDLTASANQQSRLQKKILTMSRADLDEWIDDSEKLNATAKQLALFSIEELRKIVAEYLRHGLMNLN